MTNAKKVFTVAIATLPVTIQLARTTVLANQAYMEMEETVVKVTMHFSLIGIALVEASFIYKRISNIESLSDVVGIGFTDSELNKNSV